QALNNITEEVLVINDMNHQVANAVREQTQMAASVEQSISEINASAENTSTRAQELSSVSEHLTDLSKQLEQMVSRFKL
ncbi:MAG: methyl-accepting chemotaxis protein, partial [Oceanospirillales bacterium]|nr:methyl-accepting chemotaxis protein [Oceanospirillales bacterium]